MSAHLMAGDTALDAAAADAALDAAAATGDPALPALAVLLDDAALDAWVTARGAPLPGGLRVDRLRHKPGTTVRAAAVAPDGRRWLLHGFADPTWDKHGKDLDAGRALGLPVAADPGLRLVAVPAVADRHLHGLARLRPDAGPRAREDVLAAVPSRPRAWLAERCPAGPCTVTTLAHNPARRWVGLLGGPGGAVAAVKLHAAAGPARRAAAATGLLVRHGVPVVDASPVGRDRWSLTGWVDGAVRPVGAGPDGGLAAAVADVLARLDRVPVTAARHCGLPVVEPGDVLAAAAATVRELRGLDPALGERAARVLLRLRDASALGALQPASVAHGDLDPGQVVRAGNGRGMLLDLDRAAVGPRGWDAASWAAAAVVERVCGAAPVADLPGPAPAPSVRAAAALVRLTEPWRRRRPGRAVAAEALVALAEDALAAGSAGPRVVAPLPAGAR